MIDKSKYAFIKGTYIAEADTRKAIKSTISHAQATQKECVYGFINESGDLPVLFSTNKAGLMPGATIYHDVAQYDASLSLSIKDNDCYVLFVKDKKVLFEDVLNLSALTEPDINSLKLFIFQLGQDAHLICDEQPSTDDDGAINFKGKLSLPFNVDNVVIKPKLKDIFDIDNLATSVEYKALTLDGEIIKRKWIFSISSLSAAVCIVGWVNLQPFQEENIERGENYLSSVVEKINTVIPESPKVPEVDYSGLSDWYTQKSINPFPVLSELSKQVRLFESIDGWQVVKISFSSETGNGVVSIVLKENEGADIKSVSDIAVRDNWKVSFKDKQFTVFKNVPIKPLFANSARFQISSYEKFISTAIKDWWDGTSFESTPYSLDARKPSTHQGASGDVTSDEQALSAASPYEMKLLKIRKSEYTSFDLHSFGSLLRGYPYSLKTVELTKAGFESAEESNRQSRRARNEIQPTEENVGFDGYDANFELILAGVVSR